MYYISIDNKEIPVETLSWVKSQTNGVYISCPEPEGEGIIVKNEIYHVKDRPQIDKPTAIIRWQDDMVALKESNDLLRACVMELAALVYANIPQAEKEVSHE